MLEHPEETLDSHGQFSRERYSRYVQSCVARAEAMSAAPGVACREHRVLCLVDLQGIYLALTRWLRERDFPLENGLVVSRLAVLLLKSVIQQIEDDVMSSEAEGAITFERLVDLIYSKKLTGSRQFESVTKIEPSIELFYAPAPLKDIAWQLRKEERKGSHEARRQLRDLERGILSVHQTPRDYSVYDDFIKSLMRDPLVSRSEQGFFNFYVGARGLQSFDEKEVDIRIAVRAVDACHASECDALCVVSSDQDFMPLHERCERAGLRSFQADVTRLSGGWPGRRLKNLGAGFIAAGTKPEWPLRIIIEASRPVGLYDLSARELEALCRIHNGMNEVQLGLVPQPDGTMGFKVFRPL